MTDDIKPVAWAIFRDGALAWDYDYPFSDEPQSMMDDEESRPLYGGEVIAEIERLRADRDDVRAELTNLQVAFNDWKVTHSTVRLEVEIERLRADKRTLIDQLRHIRTHLYAATVQRSPADDKIIADHIEQAYLRANEVIAEMEKAND